MIRTSAEQKSKFLYSGNDFNEIRRNARETSSNLEFKSFDSLQESTMDYRLTMFLRMFWVDPRKGSFINIDILLHSDVLKAIWKPDLFFSNEKEGSPHKIITENALIRIREDGQVYVSIRLTVVAACRMYLNHFPMDVQVCNLRAESFGYNTNDVQFHWTARRFTQVAHTLALKPSSFSRNGLIREHSSTINNKTKKDLTLARNRLLSHSNLRPFISPRNFVLGFILDLDRGYTRPYFSWNHHSPHNLLDAKRSSHVFAKSFIYKGYRYLVIILHGIGFRCSLGICNRQLFVSTV
ncbi:unnamed protein product [Oikopleura dioica]|uniref:Neurotransmitter-gated ion-channel ligand-binding domain-containing protein n=1 Tax=Oikopleura dioica TaxID=34765 RepID=E4WWM9_OIKDI|nr:unnamed protein product [Oikopleura dioica]CBY32361.1 unnamed protein product [Oikopleura dioica]